MTLKRLVNGRADLLAFVELRPFQEAWRALRLSDDDLIDLQNVILAAPQRHPVLSGAGGLRKLRFAPTSWAKGKRGAVRVGYAYLASYGIILLVIAYDKSQKEDLSAGEKKTIRRLLERIEKDLAQQAKREG